MHETFDPLSMFSFRVLLKLPCMNLCIYYLHTCATVVMVILITSREHLGEGGCAHINLYQHHPGILQQLNTVSYIM